MPEGPSSPLGALKTVLVWRGGSQTNEGARWTLGGDTTAEQGSRRGYRDRRIGANVPAASSAVGSGRVLPRQPSCS